MVAEGPRGLHLRKLMLGWKNPTTFLPVLGFAGRATRG